MWNQDFLGLKLLSSSALLLQSLSSSAVAPTCPASSASSAELLYSSPSAPQLFLLCAQLRLFQPSVPHRVHPLNLPASQPLSLCARAMLTLT
mmetsp:Transcript_7571/g.11996  ORF Transcript_7571/g.11996 Transcript_7571/m.11996 type:complete len:92 (+) Transcript_7571:163-438(+)